MKYKQVFLDLWKHDGLVVVGGTEAQFLAWVLKTFDVVIDPEDRLGVTLFSDHHPWIMWIKNTNPTIIAHEAFHVTCNVLKGRGLGFAVESEEAFAYTMEYVMGQILDKKNWKPLTNRGFIWK